MLTSMARRPPSHVHHVNGLHHQPYHSKTSFRENDDEEADDTEEQRDARRARSRLLATKLSESLAHRSSSSASNSNKEDSIEQRIQTAIDIGDIETLRKIYSQSSCPVSIDRRFKSGGWTALIHAAYACHFALVSLLVSEYQANVNQTSSEKITPLMACCMSSHSKSSTTNGNEEQLRICRFLLEQGALIEPDDEQFNDENLLTPLMFAARFGCSSALIHLLVQYGAKIDRKDAKGWSPLIMATQHGHLESVQALIQSGADIYATTNNGLTALDIAQHSKHQNIVEYLLKKQNQPTSSSTSSTVNGRNNEQSRSSLKYFGLVTAIGAAFLFGFVYLRRH